MKKVLIYGITDLAEILFGTLQLQNTDISGFVVEREYKDRDKIHHLPVYELENLQTYFSPQDTGIYICVGYTQMNEARKRIYYILKNMGYTILTYIHPKSVIASDKIGEGCIILESVSLGVYSQIGVCNICYPGSIISHHSIVGDFNYFSVSASIAGHINIGNNNFFGNNVTTKDKISIPNYVLAGAGAYINQKLKDYEVIVPERSVVLESHISTDYL